MFGGEGDLFDEIILADERFRGRGFQEGYEVGQCRGLQTGHRHGTSHGAKLSTEISFYYGFSFTWKCLLQDNTDPKSRKRLKTLQGLLGMIQDINLKDTQSQKLQEDVEKLRMKFRQVCSQLCVPADFKDYVLTPQSNSF